MLIDKDRFISEEIKDKCLFILKNNKDLACPDQDALNIVCQDKVKFFDQVWNFQWHHSIGCNSNQSMGQLIKEDEKDYEFAKNNIKILHFTSNIKPWNSPDQEQSIYFWKYAKQSPFFMDVLRDNITHHPV